MAMAMGMAALEVIIKECRENDRPSLINFYAMNSRVISLPGMLVWFGLVANMLFWMMLYGLDILASKDVYLLFKWMHGAHLFDIKNEAYIPVSVPIAGYL